MEVFVQIWGCDAKQIISACTSWPEACRELFKVAVEKQEVEDDSSAESSRTYPAVRSDFIHHILSKKNNNLSSCPSIYPASYLSVVLSLYLSISDQFVSGEDWVRSHGDNFVFPATGNVFFHTVPGVSFILVWYYLFINLSIYTQPNCSIKLRLYLHFEIFAVVFLFFLGF